MSLALRLLEGFVGMCALLFTILWGWVLSSEYVDFSTFISEQLPFPLLLPILVGVLTILNVEILIRIMTSDGEDTVMTKTEKRVGRAILNRTETVTDWNSRSDTIEKERD